MHRRYFLLFDFFCFLLCLPAQSQAHGVCYTRRDGPLFVPLCEEAPVPPHCQSPTKWPLAGYWCAWYWPDCQKQTPWVWHEGPMSSSGTCAQSPVLCSSIGICRRTPVLAGPPLALCCLDRWEQVHTDHMWRTWKSLETLWWTLPVTSSSMIVLVLGQWWSRRAYLWRLSQTSMSWPTVPGLLPSL